MGSAGEVKCGASRSSRAQRSPGNERRPTSPSTRLRASADHQPLLWTSRVRCARVRPLARRKGLIKILCPEIDSIPCQGTKTSITKAPSGSALGVRLIVPDVRPVGCCLTTTISFFKPRPCLASHISRCSAPSFILRSSRPTVSTCVIRSLEAPAAKSAMLRPSSVAILSFPKGKAPQRYQSGVHLSISLIHGKIHLTF